MSIEFNFSSSFENVVTQTCKFWLMKFHLICRSCSCVLVYNAVIILTVNEVELRSRLTCGSESESADEMWSKTVAFFFFFFFLVDRASCNDSWKMTNEMHKFFFVFISIYNSLHVSSTQCSSSGETDCFNTASGNSHSMLVAEMCSGWKKTRVFFQPAHILATNIDWLLPEAVLKQSVSPDDEHCVLKTCKEL